MSTSVYRLGALAPVLVLPLLLPGCAADADPKDDGASDADDIDTDDTHDTDDTGGPSFSALQELFDEPAGEWFGVTSGGRPRDPATCYAVPNRTGDNRDDLIQPWFDVGNNSLLAELDDGGRVEYPFVLGPLSGFATGTDGSASYAADAFIAGSPWRFRVDTGRGEVVLDTLDGVAVESVGDQLFRWNYALDGLNVTFVPFAPSDGSLATEQPRALVALFRVENTSGAPLTGHLLAPEGVPDADSLGADALAELYGPSPWAGSNHPDTYNWIPRFSEVGYAHAGYEAALPLDGAAWDGAGRLAFSLEPGESTILSLGLVVGAGTEELAYTRDRLREHDTLEWLNTTWGKPRRLLGTLDVPEDTYVPAMMARYTMVGNDAFLFDGTGAFRHPRSGSWVLMGQIAPVYMETLLAANLGVECPISESTVSWSLYGTTLLPLIAGEVYQWSGATTDLGDGTGFEVQYRCLVESILATQYDDVALFPSTRIWDGPSRGDYHVGSNIAVWYVLRAGARFAEDLWADPVTAATWSAKADEVRAALLERGVVDSWFDDQFAEGTFADGRIDEDVTCHDGEEIMVALSSVFGFVEPDDPRRTRHGVSALSTQNAFYEPAIDAVYWAEGAPVTAPGWLTALSGATTEQGVRDAIALWRSRTDVDGSIYWWPYDYTSDDPADIKRRLSYGGSIPIDTPKVDYASSNAVSLLIHDVFGLSGDVPDAQVRFRPHVPWSSFTWTDAPVGTGRFDLTYVDDGASVTATLTNRNTAPWDATVEVTVPSGTFAWSPAATGVRYARDSVADRATLAPGESLTVTVAYTDAATDACVSDAWDSLRDAHTAIGDWEENAAADADDDDIPEGWAFRLLAEARCADAAVEAAWDANLARCDTLGWGDDWATLCAGYATVSSDLEGVVRSWNGVDLGLAPHRLGREEPLSATGDFDNDGVDNLSEFLSNGGALGSRDRYAILAVGG